MRPKQPKRLLEARPGASTSEDIIGSIEGILPKYAKVWFNPLERRLKKEVGLGESSLQTPADLRSNLCYTCPQSMSFVLAYSRPVSRDT